MTPRIICTVVSVLLFLCFGIMQVHAQALDIVNSIGDTLLHVENNGFIGMGTTAPAKALHVKAVSNEIARFETTQASGNSFLSIRNATGQFANMGRFKNGTDDYFFLDLDGGGFGEFIVTNSGNVGIGTTNPGAKLEVAGQVKITGGTPAAGKVLTSDAAGLATWETATGGGDASYGSSGASPNNAVFVSDNGNVGIGAVGNIESLLTVGANQGPEVLLVRENSVIIPNNLLGTIMFDGQDGQSTVDASVMIEAYSSESHNSL